MKSWQFDPATLTIKNIADGTWEFDLKTVKGEGDLLYWILQAARHDFNMKELFDTFLEAGRFCFDTKAINGAVMLQEIYNSYPSESGTVSWADSQKASRPG